MKPVEILQDEVKITLEQPNSIIIEIKGHSVTLTEENTELLRLMLYNAYQSKRWKYSRKEKSAKNKALWALAKAQGKQRADDNTQKVYKRLQKETETAVGIGYLDLENVDIGDLSIEDIGIGDLNIEDISFPEIGDFDLPDYDYKSLGL